MSRTGKTTIQWATDVWNPVTGCTKVSAGCKNCYAETVAERFWAKQYPAGEGDQEMDGVFYRRREFTDVWCHEDRLSIPLRWKKPRRIFVNSMSDLFHEVVPTTFIDRVLEVIAACPQHTFIVLTKRAERLEEAIYGLTAENPCRELGGGDYLPNLWLGVSVEDQATADERIPLLLQALAAVRFVSYEPALGPVDFQDGRHWLSGFGWGRGLDWVIAGGESGPHARPCEANWIRSIVSQCQGAHVPVFVKQLGAKASVNGISQGLHKQGSVPSEWPADLRVRKFPVLEIR